MNTDSVDEIKKRLDHSSPNLISQRYQHLSDIFFKCNIRYSQWVLWKENQATYVVSNKIPGQTPIQKINHGLMIDERPYNRNIEKHCQHWIYLEHRNIMLNPLLPKWNTKPSKFVKTVHTKDIRETNRSYSVYLFRNFSSVYQKVQKEKLYNTLDFRLLWTLQKDCDQ